MSRSNQQIIDDFLLVDNQQSAKHMLPRNLISAPTQPNAKHKLGAPASGQQRKRLEREMDVVIVLSDSDEEKDAERQRSEAAGRPTNTLDQENRNNSSIEMDGSGKALSDQQRCEIERKKTVGKGAFAAEAGPPSGSHATANQRDRIRSTLDRAR